MGVAQKLGPPRPFVFRNQNGHISLNFAATKKFKTSFGIKKIQCGCILYIFFLAQKILELSSKTR